jgi:hypothetical protein
MASATSLGRGRFIGTLERTICRAKVLRALFQLSDSGELFSPTLGSRTASHRVRHRRSTVRGERYYLNALTDIGSNGSVMVGVVSPTRAHSGVGEGSVSFDHKDDGWARHKEGNFRVRQQRGKRQGHSSFSLVSCQRSLRPQRELLACRKQFFWTFLLFRSRNPTWLSACWGLCSSPLSSGGQPPFPLFPLDC